jgi:hypothetical protein
MIIVSSTNSSLVLVCVNMISRISFNIVLVRLATKFYLCRYSNECSEDLKDSKNLLYVSNRFNLVE